MDSDPTNPSPGPAQVECTGCGLVVTLEPVGPSRPGYVRIDMLDGWTAPPPRCPECSRYEPRDPSPSVTEDQEAR